MKSGLIYGSIFRWDSKKACNIKAFPISKERSTVSRLHVAHLSSPSANLLFKPYQNGSNPPENQGFPGGSCTQMRGFSSSRFEQICCKLPRLFVVNDGETSGAKQVFRPSHISISKQDTFLTTTCSLRSIAQNIEIYHFL